MLLSESTRKVFKVVFVLLVSFLISLVLSSCYVKPNSNAGKTLSAPNLKIVKMYANGVDLSWNSVSGAKGYVLFLLNLNNGDKNELKIDEDKNEIHVDMKTGQKFKIFLKAFNDSTFSPPSNVLVITPLYAFNGKWTGEASIREVSVSLALDVSQKDGKLNGILTVKSKDNGEEKKQEIFGNINVLNGDVEFLMQGKNRSDGLNFKGTVSTDELKVEGYVHSQLNCHDLIVGSWNLEKVVSVR